MLWGTTVGAVLGTLQSQPSLSQPLGWRREDALGFTAVVVAVLFVLSIFFIPLLSGIPAFATTPALVIVGV
jgi:AGZA family xanthine/uracil permease-like MFS transporter